VDDWNSARSLSWHGRVISCHGLLSSVHAYQNHLLRRALPNWCKSIIPRPHHDEHFSSTPRSNFLLIYRCSRVGSCRSSFWRPHHHDQTSRDSCLTRPQPAVFFLTHPPGLAMSFAVHPPSCRYDLPCHPSLYLRS
jgi:hypothetical protein